jgi:O-antigen/teichoic acid export membrane protein
LSGSIERSVAKGVAWVSVAAAIVAALDLVTIALILKFWTTATEFGIVSIALTMFGALQLAGEAGLPAALVQRGTEDDDRVSTIYWLGLLTGGGLYALIFLAAPSIARLYDQPTLVDVFRIAGLLLVIRPFYTTHSALLRRQLRFRELSIVRIIANLAEAVTKLVTAATGAGALAFVFGPIVREICYAVGIPLTARWRPKLRFRLTLVRADYRFGLRATGGELLFQMYSNIDYQVVAHAFGAQALGIYRAAYELVLEPVRFASGVVTVVAFPAFARLRDTAGELAEQFVSFTRQNLTFVLVLVGVIVVSAADLLMLAFGPTYVAAVDAARILAIVAVLRALSHLGPPLFDGVGRPDLTLRYQATAATLVTAALIAGGVFGSSYLAVAVAWAVAYPIAFGLLLWMVLRQIRMDGRTFFRRLAPLVAKIIAATACGGVTHLILIDSTVLLRLAATSTTIVGLAFLLLRSGRGMRRSGSNGVER